MYKGYCVSEQEVVATKKTIFCLFALRRGLAPLHSRVLFTPICPTLALLKGLWMSQLQFTSSTRNRRKHLGIWWGRDVSGTECTSQSRNRRGSKVHLITCFSLCSFSEEEASSSRGVTNDRFIHTLNLLLLSFSAPFYRLVLSHLFFCFLRVEWCDCWVSSTGYWQPTGLHKASLYKSTNSRASISSHCKRSQGHALFTAGAHL